MSHFRELKTPDEWEQDLIFGAASLPGISVTPNEMTTLRDKLVENNTFQDRPVVFSLEIKSGETTRRNIVRRLKEMIFEIEAGMRGVTGNGGQFWTKMSCEDKNSSGVTQ
jgi:hypothetical protein